MKRNFAVLALILISHFAFSDDSGNGCKIGQNYVYTEYLGEADPYGGQQKLIYYNSNGPRIPIYWGHGHNEYQGYRCGYINVYPASSYYDYVLKKNVPIPAENEFTFEGKQCVIAPALGARPVNTDAYVSYSYNKTGKCGGPPQNIPLNDHVWMMLLLVAGFGALAIKKKMINSSMV